MFLALSRFLKTFLLPIRQCCGLHIISSSLPGGDTDALGLCHEGHPTWKPDKTNMWRYLLRWPVVDKRASESLLCWNVTKMHQERRAQQWGLMPFTGFLLLEITTKKRLCVWEIPPWNTHTHFLTTRTAKNISGVQSVYIIDPECISHRVTRTKRLGRVNESECL